MSKPSPVDEIIRVGNALIAENERLTKAIADQAEEIRRLREALAIVQGDESFEKRKTQVLATTGAQPFLWATDDEETTGNSSSEDQGN